MKSALLSALLLLLLAGCAVAGDEDSAARAGKRIFTVGDLAIRADGRILLAGVARRGDWDSKQDDYCRGEGPATSDFAVVHLSPAGRLVETHSRSEQELDACAVEVTEAKLTSEEALLVLGVIRESPGFFPGEGGPEERERGHAVLFDPGPEDVHSYEDDRVGAELAGLRVPDGDWVVIGEDSTRQRRDPRGLYSGTMSLVRWGEEDSPEWSFPVRAISPKADLAYEEGRGWELFFDARRGFYGFVHYQLVSGEVEVVLFRHRLDGRPDSTFGDRGRVLVAPRAPWSFWTKRAVRAPGEDLVVSGEAGESGRLILRRYTASGDPVGSFDRTTAGAGAVACGTLEALEVQADGKLVLACALRGRGGTAVVRLLPDGRLDPSFGRKGKVVIRTV